MAGQAVESSLVWYGDVSVGIGDYYFTCGLSISNRLNKCKVC